MLIGRLLGAVAVAGEHLIPVASPPGRLCGGEDSLDVNRAVAGRLGRIVHHDLAEVPLGAQRQGGQPPYLLAIRSNARARTGPSRCTCSSIFGNRLEPVVSVRSDPPTTLTRASSIGGALSVKIRTSVGGRPVAAPLVLRDPVFHRRHT